MNVAFLIGAKSKDIARSMANSADNVKFFTYQDIPTMISESTLRHVFFDRVVLSENVLTGGAEDLKALNNYIMEYSDSTSVVLVCKSNSSEYLGVFNELFNSPLYTPVVTEKVSIKLLLDFVKGDILELKSNYYTADSKEVKAVSNKYTPKETSNTPAKEPEKPVKKGFFSSLFGGKKNDLPKTENTKPAEEVAKTVGNTVEGVSKIAGETAKETVVGSVGNASTFVPNTQGLNYEEKQNSFGSDYTRGSQGEVNSGDGISPDFSDLDNLELGELGESHVDTGFLDEEEEEDLQSALSSGVSEIMKDSEQEEKPKEDSVSFNGISEEEKSSNKILLMIGQRGIGLTSRITYKAVDMASKGMKVLVVDLDYKENGLLSFINVKNLYSRGCSNGIKEKKVYEEDGVAIVSNGYMNKIDSADVVSLLESSDIYWKYDCIMLDCPLDCLDCITKDIIESSDVFIHVNGNRGSITATIQYIVGQGSEFEDALYKNSKILVNNKISEYEEDLTAMRQSMLFGRGDWLSKLS